MKPPGWRYNTVSATFWDDEKVRAWTEDGQRLALYLLTCSHRTAEGFYRLPIATGLDDLKWTRKRWDIALVELAEAGFCEYDEPARLVLIRKALKYAHRIGGHASIQGALNILENAKGSPRLFGQFLAAADRYQGELAAAIRHKYELPEGPYEGP